MPNHKLSIIIPTYNEAGTILQVLERIERSGLPASITREMIICDDGSTDGTIGLVESYRQKKPDVSISIIRSEMNRGKGAAVRTGLAHVSGDLIIIQDADLEYDPKEYHKLLLPILKNQADVVYGSRFRECRFLQKLQLYNIANFFLTFLSNLFTGLKLTDMETCYKVFKSPIINRLDLKEQRFGIEPELTAKVAKIPGLRLTEVPISYHRRGFGDGKKLRIRDGIRAIYCIIKYRFVD